MLKTGIANLPLHAGKCPRWLFPRMKKLAGKDPVKFSFAHGGKDGVPYVIGRKHYDEATEIIKNAIKDAKLDTKDKLKAIRRLSILHT